MCDVGRPVGADVEIGFSAVAGAPCWIRSRTHALSVAASCVRRVSGLCRGTRGDLLSKDLGALVRIGGPLRPFADGCLADLVEPGHALRTAQFELPMRRGRLWSCPVLAVYPRVPAVSRPGVYPATQYLMVRVLAHGACGKTRKRLIPPGGIVDSRFIPKGRTP